VAIRSHQHCAGWRYAVQSTEVTFRNKIAISGHHVSGNLGNNTSLPQDTRRLEPPGAPGSCEKRESIEK
jgi:hypothetical protein